MGLLRGKSASLNRVIFLVVLVCVLSRSGYGAPWAGSGDAYDTFHEKNTPTIHARGPLVFVDHERNSASGMSTNKLAYATDCVIFKLAEHTFEKTIDSSTTQLFEIELQKRHNLGPFDIPIKCQSTERFAAIRSVAVPPCRSPMELCEDLSADPDVEWAEPIFYRYTDLVYPDDPYMSFSYQSYLYRVYAPYAWEITTGTSDVIIAIIDTGIEYIHPDLADNIWVNAGETALDGLDNDDNGFVDDVRGWDFVTVPAEIVYTGEDPGPQDNDPDDFGGHGTSVAGIAGAVGNNAIGISGTCWDVSLMPLRAGYKNSSGQQVLESTAIAEALIYAADNGADIVNMSFGSDLPSILERDAIDYCAEAGVLLVASAGNDATDAPHYPAAYDNVMAVSGLELVSYWEEKYPYSNYGIWTDISANATSMYSTRIGGGYSFESGTSMSSPLVAGVAGLVKSVYPLMTAEELSTRLRATANNINEDNIGFENKLGAGKVNALKAITAVSIPTRLGVVNLYPQEVIGSPDGILEPNETIELKVSAKNFALAQGEVSVLLTSEDPYISIIDGEAYIGQIGENQVGTSSDDSLIIAIDSNTPKDHQVLLEMHFSTQCQSSISPDNIHLRLNDLLNPIFMLAEHLSGLDYISAQILTNLAVPEVTALYQSNQFLENQIYARKRDISGAWSPAVRISEGVPAARVPHGVLMPDGRVHAIFLSMVDGDGELCYVTQDPISGSWSVPSQITTGAKIYDWDIIPSRNAENFIAASPDGNIHVVWVDYRSGSIEFYHIYHNGSVWSPEAQMPTPSGDLQDARDHHFIFDSAGNGYLFWIQEDMCVYMMKYSSNTWSLPEIVVTNIGSFSVCGNSQNKVDMVYALWETGYPIMYQQYSGTTWSTPEMIMSDSQTFGIYVQTASDDSVHVITNDVSNDNLFLTIFDSVSWSTPIPLIYDGLKRYWFYMDFGMGKSDEYYIIGAVETPPSTRNDVLFATSHREPNHLASIPVVIDDGDVTENQLSLSATWSSYHYTGIAEYMYSIGTAPGSPDFRNWVSTGTATGMTANLSSTPLKPGQTYYISVKAQNNLGLWSRVGSSDGITCTGGILEPIDCTKYGGGSGTINDPYLIATSEHMNTIGENPEDWGKHFILVADIDISQYYTALYNIIGNSTTPFTGTFDGLGHSITGFNFKLQDAFGYSHIGLFGDVDAPDAHIRNLILYEPDINVPESTAALVGKIDAGTISNCSVRGGLVNGEDYTGAIAGGNGGNIIQCYSTCDVNGSDHVGGLVGRNSGTIEYCYATGNVSGETLVGGLAGRSSNAFSATGVISNSYASGNVSGNFAGGLVGQQWGGNIVNSYSVGHVSGADTIGGLVGDTVVGGLSSNCFWDVNTSEQTYSAQGLGKTTTQMQLISTFTPAGWDFADEVINGTEDIWEICEGTNYPKFVWQIPIGDFICPDGVNMVDFAVLGEAWFSDPNMGNWEAACDISEPEDGVIDGLDLAVFVNNWLEGI